MLIRQKTRGRFSVILGLAAAAAILSTACQHPQLSQRRLNDRLAGVRSTADAAYRGEATRPAKLGSTLDVIGREARLDAQSTQRNLLELQRLAELDVRRWTGRQPTYQRAAARELWNDPRRIEPTFINLFY